jgi:hypothetical protein
MASKLTAALGTNRFIIGGVAALRSDIESGAMAVRDVQRTVARHAITARNPLRALVRTLARQAARELFARELATQRPDRPEVTLQ